MTKYNGKNVYTHWGEGRAMTDWQVNVTYTHSDSWEGYRQTCEIGQFAGLVDKLNRGEDVTFIFYGDSITNGASASFVYNYAPQQFSYPLLLTQALADLFGYNVHYVQTGLNGTSRIPNRRITRWRMPAGPLPISILPSAAGIRSRGWITTTAMSSRSSSSTAVTCLCLRSA